MAVFLLAGCGGGSDARATACSALDLRAVNTASGASRALRSAIAADRAALDALDVSDPLAARFRAAKAKAERALGAFSGDPLRSGSMSPTVTILPTAQRVIAETRSLRAQLCG